MEDEEPIDELAAAVDAKLGRGASTPPPQAGPLVCANCDRTLGRLERPIAWQGHWVCTECAARLGANQLQYASPSRRSSPRVQPIELTGKRWKAMQLIGIVVFLGGSAWAIIEAQGAGRSFWPLVLPGVVASLGLFVYLVAASLAWWYHG